MYFVDRFLGADSIIARVLIFAIFTLALFLIIFYPKIAKVYTDLISNLYFETEGK